MAVGTMLLTCGGPWLYVSEGRRRIASVLVRPDPSLFRPKLPLYLMGHVKGSDCYAMDCPTTASAVVVLLASAKTKFPELTSVARTGWSKLARHCCINTEEPPSVEKR